MWQIGVSDEISAHGDEVGLLALDLTGSVITVEVTTSQEENSGRLEDVAEDVKLVLVAKTSDLAAEIRPSEADLVRADGISASLENFKDESTAVLNGTTILIGAGVDVVVQELLKKVTVCA
ncbi:hypothetical protein HG530_009167 [Fusarium avenaceum]|nr:hypothetical protein HG530_009167 [Fusarium avenaceum]